MTSLRKPFLLMLATFALASCGGGGGGSHSVFTPPGNDTAITLFATTTTLPASPYTVGEEQTAPFPGNFLGSPYIAEVTVSWRHNNGDLINGTSQVNVAAAPTQTISFSTLVTTSGGTDGSNQFTTLIGNGNIGVNAGVGTIYVHAGQTPGQGVLTVSGIDPVSGQTVSSSLTFTVVGASSGVPASISVSGANGVYTSGSGGSQSTVVTATLKDGSGAFLSAPSGVSNVQFTITGPANSDATLTGVDGAGASHTGKTVNVASHNGIATVSFQSGSQQGSVQVQATADKGDNNVDNGVSSPVSATTSIAVSDGRLDSLTLSFNGESAPSILINRVSTAATLVDQTTDIPPDPDATYSLTVTAQGTDRQGNPALTGTQIRFGAIDTPVDARGNFLISGIHGDPEESGFNFNATDGHFISAGGGAGPGDTLLVIGKHEQGAPLGNDDLESASKVTSVLSETHLVVATPFNYNDTTGLLYNAGPVLPYIVGRAQIGNITSPASTNANGRATTTLNYPVSELGHTVAIWAQGTSTDAVNGTTKLVTDIAVIGFPGVADATIVVSPSPIPGNITVPVTACLLDHLGSPIRDVQFQFAFANLGVGSGSVDGIANGGTVPDLTDASGCVVTTVKTTGIGTSATAGTPQLIFSAGTASQATTITATGGDLVLLANPSALIGNGGIVTLTLLNGNGTPVPGVQLTGTCTGDPSLGIVSGIPVTGTDGTTKVSIAGNLNQPNTPLSGSCTFKTASGTPTVTVTVQGVDTCSPGTSPTNPACTGGTTTNGNSTVSVTINSPTSTPTSITSNPGGVSCSLGTGTTQTCSVSVPGGTYNLLATANGTWSGSCTPTATANQAKLVVPAAATTLTCTLNAP